MKKKLVAILLTCAILASATTFITVTSCNKDSNLPDASPSTESSSIIDASSTGDSSNQNEKPSTPTITTQFTYNLTSDSAGNAGYNINGYITLADTDIIIPETYNNLPIIMIGESVFKNCKQLTSVTLPKSIISIHSQAFRDCTNLSNIIIPEQTTYIGDLAFYGCTKLENVIFSENSELLQMGKACFAFCSSLTSIDIPNGVIGIADKTFSSCTMLKHITLPSTLSSLSEDTFFNCSNLESIILPLRITYMENNVFKGCSKLTIYAERKETDITIPSEFGPIAINWTADWNPDNRPIEWGYTEE